MACTSVGNLRTPSSLRSSMAITSVKMLVNVHTDQGGLNQLGRQLGPTELDGTRAGATVDESNRVQVLLALHDHEPASDPVRTG